MTDDDVLKMAMETLKSHRPRGGWLTWREVGVLLAHLDGEPARLAAAREEQREACALAVADHHVHLSRREPSSDHREPGGYSAAVRATPLTATPLGDELKALREVVQGMNEGALVVVSAAEYDELKALRARVAELERSEKTLDAVCAVLGREVGNRGDSEGAVDVAERIIRERDEAVAALRGLQAASKMLLGRFQRMHDNDVLREVNEASSRTKRNPRFRFVQAHRGGLHRIVRSSRNWRFAFARPPKRRSTLQRPSSRSTRRGDERREAVHLGGRAGVGRDALGA